MYDSGSSAGNGTRSRISPEDSSENSKTAAESRPPKFKARLGQGGTAARSNVKPQTLEVWFAGTHSDM